MAKNNKNSSSEVLSYRHSERRKNNPEVGMVSPDTDPDDPKTTYSYDPHIDPTLQFDAGRFAIEKLIDDALASEDQAEMRSALEHLKRQQTSYLNWAGKAEKTSFEVDTVSLHVHERIDPASILSAVRKGMKKEKVAKAHAPSGQLGLFNAPFENLPLRDAIDFYKHDRGWANRLIAGDSLLVMNSLLQKEAMSGQLQMMFFDPPYGIKYGSNFQAFIDKREVKDGKDEDLTQEPEMLKAFRDTWELGIHSYLSYLRDRLLLARELLADSGSVFVQISDENLHHVRELMDEIFGAENFCRLITFRKKNMPLGAKLLESTCDYIVWYAKNKDKVKFHSLYADMDVQGDNHWNCLEEADGTRRKLKKEEIDNHKLLPKGSRIYRYGAMFPAGVNPSGFFDVEVDGEKYAYPIGKGWKTNPEGMNRLKLSRRVEPWEKGKTLGYVIYLDDSPVTAMADVWLDSALLGGKIYVVQTSTTAIERCMLMTTDPGDLVFDPTCGSGTTAFVAEKWGRRWITCDSSRVALTLAKQRLMTASFDYYELKYPHEGLRGGFVNTTVPHITMGSITNNQDIDLIYERFQADLESKSKKISKAAGVNLDAFSIPVSFPDGWPEELKKEFNDFNDLRTSFFKQVELTIKSQADSDQLFDRPLVDKSKLRITGPFTVEAVPSPMVTALDEDVKDSDADRTISRSGESQRHHDWKDELIKTGIRGKNGQILKLLDVETLPDVKYIHASGTVAETGERVVVSFGPEYSLLEQRQVEMAMREAGELFPRPKMILFCGFDFDPEAAKDIDSTKGIIALRVKMNADLLTNDLKKQRSSNQSFWLMGQPDVQLNKTKDGLWQVEVNGFDYFDTVKGELISGGKGNIASWMLDTDYDGRSTFPRQVFFPMAGSKDGWSKLRKDIKAELDESALNKFSGTVSLPFEAGENNKIAVKIVDDRGIESLKVLDLED